MSLRVEIEEVDLRSLRDEDVVARNEFDNLMAAEAWPEDPPIPVERTRASTHNMPAYLNVREFWVRDDDDRIAASALCSWPNTDENTHLVGTHIRVRADHRGRGIGRELLRSVVDVAKTEGRTMLSGATNDRVVAGEAFARRVGATLAQRVTENRLILADLDSALVARWVSEGPSRAPGYSIVAVDGPFPDDVIENAVAAYDIMNTAPLDDLQRENATLTVEQMREIEKQGVATGSERWLLFARDDSDGRFVGLTELFWNPSDGESAYQGDTGVHPDHRGKALGKWLKAVNLERLVRERPGVVDVYTGNADSNDAMLGINHELGFAPYSAWFNWDLPVELAEAYLGSSA